MRLINDDQKWFRIMKRRLRLKISLIKGIICQGINKYTPLCYFKKKEVYIFLLKELYILSPPKTMLLNWDVF